MHGDAHREGTARGDDLLEHQLVTAHTEERDRVAAGVDRQKQPAVVGAYKRALRGKRVGGGAAREATHAASGVGAGQGERAVPGALVDHDRVGTEIVRLYEQVLLRVPAPTRGEGARGGGKHEPKDDHHGRTQGKRQEGLRSFHCPSRSMSTVADLRRSLGFPHTVIQGRPGPRPTPAWRPSFSQAHPPTSPVSRRGMPTTTPRGTHCAYTAVATTSTVRQWVQSGAPSRVFTFGAVALPSGTRPVKTPGGEANLTRRIQTSAVQSCVEPECTSLHVM